MTYTKVFKSIKGIYIFIIKRQVVSHSVKTMTPQDCDMQSWANVWIMPTAMWEAQSRCLMITNYFFLSHPTFTYQFLTDSVKKGSVLGKRKWQ